MLEGELIRHAAPTLAGIKVASLFSARTSPAEINAVDLSPLALTTLRQQKDRFLLYLYHPSWLARIMSQMDVQRFLASRGYTVSSIDALLNQLRVRLLHAAEFPHEVGLFLGYPLADVEGFIRHRGQDCLLSGCWKVYSNAAEAQQTFAQYRRCQRFYAQLYASGVPLDQLISHAPAATAPRHPHHSGRSQQ